MSAVYLGRRVDGAGSDQHDIPQVVALKIVRHDVRLDERMLQMFLEEGKLIARLVHPNIVRTLEVGGDADQDFIAMELMLGKTFAAIYDAMVARDVRLNPEIAAWAAARTADALHYAHELTDENGGALALVHRDVNPANVFATFHGEVKLFDFGLAKVTAGDASGSHLLAGKLSYLSPEQIMQMQLDRRSDIFSLGTTLWELLTGRRLFRRDSDLDTVRAVQLGPIPDPRTVAPEIPEALAQIAKTALERNREHRYATAADLARDLDAFVVTRTTPSDVTARLAQLVDKLFPGEQKRQSGWLKPAISSGATRPSMGPPSMAPPPGRTWGSPSGRPSPPPYAAPREITQVMANAPQRQPGEVRATAPPAPIPSSRPSIPASSPSIRPSAPSITEASLSENPEDWHTTTDGPPSIPPDTIRHGMQPPPLDETTSVLPVGARDEAALASVPQDRVAMFPPSPADPSSRGPSWPTPSKRVGPPVPPPPQRSRPSGRALSNPPPVPSSSTELPVVHPPLPNFEEPPARATQPSPNPPERSPKITFDPTKARATLPPSIKPGPMSVPPTSGPLSGLARPKRPPIPLPSRLRDSSAKKPTPSTAPSTPTDPPGSDTKVDVPGRPGKRS